MGFEIEDISFSYNDKKAIDGLSLSLNEGKFYGIIGPNGCGKSTLLDLLAKHQTPASGRIVYKKRALAGYSRRVLSREIALVPQNFYINFPFRAEEIVMMGRYPYIPRFSRPSEKDVRIVDEIMKKTQTAEFKHRYITALSGGERQRVVFARAMAQDTPFLILDEATSNLDVNHALSLLELAKRGTENQGKTVIAVMQNMNLAAMFCEELVFMKDGRVVAGGPTDDVLTSETIRSVFGVESRIRYEPYADANQVVFKR